LRRRPERQSASHEAERTNRYREFPGHSVSLLLAKFRCRGANPNARSYRPVPSSCATLSWDLAFRAPAAARPDVLLTVAPGAAGRKSVTTDARNRTFEAAER